MKTPYTLPRPPRNRFLTRERDRRRMRDLGRLGAAILALGLALLGYTWLHLQLLGSGYRLEALDQKLHELERRERHLRLEEAYLSSPQRVEERARKELGMAAPELSQLVFVTDDAGLVAPSSGLSPGAPLGTTPVAPPGGARGDT